MAEALKEIFNRAFYRELAELVLVEHPSFEAEVFVRSATKGLAKLELNERMRRTAQLLHEHLTQDFQKNVAILKAVAPNLSRRGGGYGGIFVPEYIGRFGAEDPQLFDFCMEALRDVTEHSSSELAVREFLKRDFDRAYAYMLRWSEDENYHVRRLSSEGLRPRLPWSFRLTNLIENPAPARAILDRLNRDPELYVRKSVANHLNDISKDHPETMLDWISARAWQTDDEGTAWIKKHACRTLIKNGHPRALALFSFSEKPRLKSAALKFSRKKVKIGETVELSVRLEAAAKPKRAQNLVVDYRVHYRKQNGRTSTKVFKFREIELNPGAVFEAKKKHRFDDMTTRKHHPGEHLAELVVNGEVVATAGVVLQR